jgi:multidrug resistance efflux pump
MSWIRRRFLTLAWCAGMLALLGSLVGARQVLNSRTGTSPESGPAPSGSTANVGAWCQGNVDVDPAAAYLAPLMDAGTVVKVLVKEGQTVEAGQELIRFDDRSQRAELARANAGVAQAEGKLAEAQEKGDLTVKAHETLIKVEKKAISAKEFELKAARQDLAQAEKALKSTLTTELQVQAARERVNALEQGVEAEKEKLKGMEDTKPNFKPMVDQAKAAIDDYMAQVAKARWAVDQCVLKAPSAGVVVRVQTSDGAMYSPQMRQPPVLFRAKGPLIVRAEIEQEFVGKLAMNQEVSIRDDINPAPSWKGKVTWIADSFLPKRTTNPIADPLMPFNEPRVLEFIVTVTPDEKAPPLRIGQKVRVGVGAAE